MKKVSTAVSKGTKNFPEQKPTIGLDLGDRSSWYCVLDEAGDVLLEQRVSTTPKAMKQGFERMPRSRIALETGMHSPWVSRVLSGLGHEVIVAHARPDQCFAQRNQRATTERDAGLQRPVGTAGMTTPAKIRDPAAAEGPGAALGSL